MKQLLSAIVNSGTPKQRKQKAFAVTAILITAALIVVALVTLCALAIADAITAPAPITDDGEGGGSTGAGRDLVTTEFGENQLYQGNLIVVDDTYAYQADANAEIATRLGQNRSKIEGNDFYYMGDSVNFAATADAQKALDTMLVDFNAAKGDDNVYILKAYTIGSDNAGIYASGTTFELGYYFSVSGQNGAEATVIKPISESEVYDWIFQNAYKYGFIQLYAAKDANAAEGTPSQTHIFRYVGLEHAALAKDAKCATLDAYLTYLRENTSISKTKSVSVQVTDANGKTSKVSYKIFYQAQDAEAFYTADPNKFTATVSGDNMSGYIVSYCPIAK